MKEIKLKKKPLTREDLEYVRNQLGITQFDMGWLLGLDHRKYNRLKNGLDQVLGHSEAGLLRYMARHFDEYPYSTVINPLRDGKATTWIKEIQEICANLPPIMMKGHLINPEKSGGMGTLLFRSYSAAREYEKGTMDFTLSGARWAAILVNSLQNNKVDAVLRIILDEAIAYQMDIGEMALKGWRSRNT